MTRRYPILQARRQQQYLLIISSLDPSTHDPYSLSFRPPLFQDVADVVRQFLLDRPPPSEVAADGLQELPNVGMRLKPRAPR
jgi:hypothetical protein